MYAKIVLFFEYFVVFLSVLYGFFEGVGRVQVWLSYDAPKERVLFFLFVFVQFFVVTEF